jgi:glycosyltransferase involved in cell wall biosynthesis
LHQRDILLLALANPQPQKRLERLPEIASRLEALLGTGIAVHIAVAGEANERLPEAQVCTEALKEAARRCGLAARLHLPGSLTPEQVPEWLHAADALVSCSDHEGLSLAQLEALFAGRPVVASACGGEEDLPATAALRFLPLPDSPAAEDEFLDAFAKGLRGAVLGRPSCPSSLLQPFTASTMGLRHDLLFRQILAEEGSRGEGIFIVTDSFAGDGQASLRRLVRQFATRGRRLRLFTLQETPEFPSPGTLQLRAGGSEVENLDLREQELHEALAPLLSELRQRPPQALVFWDALAAAKCLLADVLLRCPVWDFCSGSAALGPLLREFEQPRSGHSLRTPQDYARRLSGIVCSERRAASEARRSFGIEARIIPHGIPLPLRPAVLREAPPILVIGASLRRQPQRRLAACFAALALAKEQLPPFELRLAGGCLEPEASALLRLAAEASLPVVWLGEVCDLAAFHTGLDLFVAVAGEEESEGEVEAFQEAMAAGLPVAIAGDPEMIRDGLDALLSPPGDAAALAASLLRLARDAGLRRRLGVQGRGRIQELFSVERMADACEKLWIGGD